MLISEKVAELIYDFCEVCIVNGNEVEIANEEKAAAKIMEFLKIEDEEIEQYRRNK